MPLLSDYQSPAHPDQGSSIHVRVLQSIWSSSSGSYWTIDQDAHGNEYILVIIDAFSRWVELFPTKSTTAVETASVMLNHIGRFGNPEVIHTDQGPAFHNELVQELLRLCAIEQSFATAYSSEENGIVERANQEVLRHLRALLFDSRVHDKWLFEQLPLVQRIRSHSSRFDT